MTKRTKRVDPEVVLEKLESVTLDDGSVLSGPKEPDLDGTLLRQYLKLRPFKDNR